LPALAAVLLCGGAASFIAFNNQFLVENVQAMTVVGIAWTASRAEGLAFNRLLSATVLWIALALLAKTTTLGYVLPFVAYIVAVRIITRGDARSPARPSDLGLMLAAIAATVAAVGWYALNWHSTMSHVADATAGDKALLYGSTNPLLVKLTF